MRRVPRVHHRRSRSAVDRIVVSTADRRECDASWIDVVLLAKAGSQWRYKRLWIKDFAGMTKAHHFRLRGNDLFLPTREQSMISITRNTALAVLIASAFLFAATELSAQQVVKWRASGSFPPGHSTAIAM